MPWAFIRLFLLGLLVKVLLFQSYYSTDFDVHRNWLAITSSLPLSEWYKDTTNPWTLDYPPFFAYSERFLALLAPYFDPNMLDLKAEDHRTWNTIVFQRSTVILTELVLVVALYAFAYWSPSPRPDLTKSGQAALFLALHLLTGPSLLLVDHLHFQYNGFLFGVWILSLVLISRSLRASPPSASVYLGAITFAALLHLKHLFIFCAPAYLVFLLRAVCLPPSPPRPPATFYPLRFLLLGICVLAVSALSLGPFFLSGALPALLARLFPFQRGLCHAYWAPNAWALYAALDKLLTRLPLPRAPASSSSLPAPVSFFVSKLFRTSVDAAKGGFELHSLGGCPLSMLPEPTPLLCLALVFFSMVPFLLRLWHSPTVPYFLTALAGCNLGAFLFGFHVHEKAILNTFIPLLLAEAYALATGAIRTPGLAEIGALVTATLLPLLHEPREAPLALAFLLISLVPVLFPASIDALLSLDPTTAAPPPPLLRLTAVGLIPLFFFSRVLFPLGLVPFGLGTRLPFLPLFLISVYCAVGFGGVYAQLLLRSRRNAADAEVD